LNRSYFMATQFTGRAARSKRECPLPFRMSVSLWRRHPAETIESDVAVIGAGLSGLSAAIELGRAGADCVVLERHVVGDGASTRNAGFLMRGMAENYFLCAEALGRERAREAWRWNEENIEELRAEGIAALASYRAIPSCLLPGSEGEREQLARSRDMLREDGFDVGWLESGEDSVWRAGIAPCGLVNPNDASCNPAELVAWLRSKVESPVRENAEIAEIRTADNGSLELIGPRLLVRAQRVLVCSNAFGPQLLASLRGIIEPRRGQMLALRARSARLDCSYYLNWGGEYFRQTRDDTIVIGGFRKSEEATETGYDDTPTTAIQGRIDGLARTLFPEGFEVIARWAGIMGFSPDGLPLVGPVAGDWPEGAVWFCGGFTGHGMSVGFKTARAGVRAMLEGVPTPFPLDRVIRA